MSSKPQYLGWRMKAPANLGWICASLLLGFLGGFAVGDKTPSYGELKASCADAIKMSPRLENMEVWLTANQIPTKQQPAHLFKETLARNGAPETVADEASICIYFSGFPVRGGLFSRHVVYGYFFFSDDGSLVDHFMYDIYYGM